MLVRIPLKGLLTWQLVFDYDNSNNSAAIEHSIRIRESHSISMSNFYEGILQHASRRARSEGESALDVKASYRVLSASFSSNFEFSEEVSSLVSKTREERDINWERISEEVRKCKSNVELSRRNMD
jgi:hypothetical protein